MTFDIGRVCLKIAGRHAGRLAVVVDAMDGPFVLIDGNVKRKRCNIHHLEPLGTQLALKKGASTPQVHEAMRKENLEVLEAKPRTAAETPAPEAKAPAKKPAAKKKGKKA